MVAKYWPVAAQKEESASRFPVKQVDRKSVAEYLQSGRRITMRGITLYTKPTDLLEVGFLIRRKAGNAVARNKTRRLFRGLILNSPPDFLSKTGYLFLFHRSILSGKSFERSIQQLIERAARAV